MLDCQAYITTTPKPSGLWQIGSRLTCQKYTKYCYTLSLTQYTQMEPCSQTKAQNQSPTYQEQSFTAVRINFAHIGIDPTTLGSFPLFWWALETKGLSHFETESFSWAKYVFSILSCIRKGIVVAAAPVVRFKVGQCQDRRTHMPNCRRLWGTKKSVGLD